MKQSRRLSELDGLRSLAIISVIAFHYLQRFPDYYPYGDTILPISRYGYLGVDLFFIISGFVITLSLHNSKSFLDFTLKRLIRLWPAMAFCSVVTFFAMHYIDTPFTEHRRTGVSAFLPSLTFTAPFLWSKLLPSFSFSYVDGAYWSLFVEIRFYFWAALISAMSRRETFTRNAVFIFFSALLLFVFAKIMDIAFLQSITSILFFPKYLHLFCAGILFSELWAGRNKKASWIGIGVCILIVPVMSRDANSAAITVSFFGLFALLVTRPRLLSIFCLPPLVWIGVVSYPIYLLHQNIGVAILTLLPEGLAVWEYIALVIGITCIIFALASSVYLWVEKPTQKWALTKLKRSATTRKPIHRH